MPVGVYQHKPNQGFQKGHSFGVKFKKGEPSKWRGKKRPPFSSSHIEKLKIFHTGKPSNAKGKTWKIKDSSNMGRKKEQHHNWKGGITPINKSIRESVQYKLWRKAVFERDNYQCIWGGKEHGPKLNADHIKPFAYFPELRFAIDNGRTLCEDCHKKTDTYGGKIKAK